MPHFITDIESAVGDLLEGATQTMITAQEIAEEIGIPKESINQSVLSSIGIAVTKRLCWKRKRILTNGERRWYYVSPDMYFKVGVK